MESQNTLQTPHVYQAIAAITSAMAGEGISKGNKNTQQGYSFRGIDDVYNALARHLATEGLVIIPRIVNREFREAQSKNGGFLFYVTLEAEYDLVSSRDGSRHTARVFGEAMDSADKATNKAMSAAYKYLCLQTFCIPTEGDNDADSTTHQVSAVSAPQLTLAETQENDCRKAILAIPKIKNLNDLDAFRARVPPHVQSDEQFNAIADKRAEIITQELINATNAKPVAA